MNKSNLLLELKNLHIAFYLDEGIVSPVNGVDLRIHQGEVLGLVGESGCGKSVTAQSLLRIIPPPGKITHGEILFHKQDGTTIDIANLKNNGREVRAIRGKEIAIIFQEPMSSFSPIHTIGNQIMEAVMLHQKTSKAEARKITLRMLERVGIPNAESRIDDYPFEFSGGMRQRAFIAQALSCNPTLLIADEPTTALDVTIQAQILKLMKDLQQESNSAILFITHNLGVIAQIADRIAIMYLGRVVEEGTTQQIFHEPKHPYAINLLQAIPRIGKSSGTRLISIKGVVPNPFERLSGCPFHPRCDESIPGVCNKVVPAVTLLADGHRVECLLYEERLENLKNNHSKKGQL